MLIIISSSDTDSLTTFRFLSQLSLTGERKDIFFHPQMLSTATDYPTSTSCQSSLKEPINHEPEITAINGK